MLETIRQYAREQLMTMGEAEAARHAHAAWCLTLAEEAEIAVSGPDQAAWLDRLEEEHANVRAALARGLEGTDPEISLRLGAALWRFWEVRGYLSRDEAGWSGRWPSRVDRPSPGPRLSTTWGTPISISRTMAGLAPAMTRRWRSAATAMIRRGSPGR